MAPRTQATEVTASVSRPDKKASRVQVHPWTVEVVAGPDKGKKAKTLDALVRVGTDPSNDLVLTDPTVSRRHVEIEGSAKGLLLKDLGSRNGVVVDGRQVLQAFVEPGDKLLLGNSRLAIRQDATTTEVELAGADFFGGLVGSSAPMRAVFALLRRAASEDVNLLIEGETGTGKELAARAVHHQSGRRNGPFKVVDCNLITEKNAEAELFGDKETPGAFEGGAGGTLFLDEIGELPLPLQPKLLRVLETREVRRPGDEKAKKLDVRVIASTNHNLDEDVGQERFRKDLYFRIAVARVRIPPLRTRRDDIPVLARHILKSLGASFELSPQMLSLLDGYDWPGNTRELRNVLERGALMQETGNTNWLEFLANPPKKGAEPQKSVGSLVVGMPYHEAKDRVLADFERFYFAEVMKGAAFDMKIAEQKTGLSMQSLYRLLKKNGLRLKDLKNAEGLEK
jgi:two-component system response regulator GlrR